MATEALKPGYEKQPPVVEEAITITEEPGNETKSQFKDFPTAIKCPTCHQEGITVTQFQNGNCTYLATCITCAFLPLGCALIPYSVDGFKDVIHTCPYCNTLIAVYER